MSKTIVLTMTCLGLVFFASPPPAAGQSTFHPVGPVDLYTGSMAHFDLQLGIGDDVTSLVPQLGFQYGFGNFAAGLDLGLAYADVDNLDSDPWPGNIVLFFKGKHCLEVSWQICFGGEFSMGVGLADLDYNLLDPSEQEEALAELASLAAGAYSDLRGRMFAGGVENFVFEPILAASATNGMFVFQGYFGVGVFVPLDDLKVDLGIWEAEADTDNEAALIYGLSAGGVVADLFGGTIGFRGFSTVTLEEDDSYFSLDFTLRLLLGGISPVLRFGIPLDDTSSDHLDIVITFGVVAEL